MRVVRAGLVLPAVAIVVGAACTSAVCALLPLSSLGPLLPPPSAGSIGPEGIPVPEGPVLAPAFSVPRLSRAVDGIRCQRNAHLRLHFHVRLTLIVNGKQRRLPAGVGIWPPLPDQSAAPGQYVVTSASCFSWLSTHFADGVIHTETPSARGFLLGEFFDVWGQPLGRSRVGPAQGKVTAIVNGKVWTADPRRIPLLPHEQIQLEVGRPLVAPVAVEWPGAF
jgi:hypothetical protein